MVSTHRGGSNNSGGSTGEGTTPQQGNRGRRRGGSVGRVTTASTGRQGQSNDGSTPANFADLDQQDPPSLPIRRWSLEPTNPPDHGRGDVPSEQQQQQQPHDGAVDALFALYGQQPPQEEDPPPQQPQRQQGVADILAAAGPDAPQHRCRSLDLICASCSATLSGTAPVLQCTMGACNNKVLYCSRLCFDGHHRCSPVPPVEYQAFEYVFNDINIPFDEVNDASDPKDSIYLRRIEFPGPGNERAEVKRAIEAGFHLPTIYNIISTFHLGKTVNARRRTQGANTDSVADFEQFIFPCPNNKSRVEVLLIYVFDEMGKRRGVRDFFALTQQDIIDIRNKILHYNNAGEMEFRFQDDSIENAFVDDEEAPNNNRTINIRTFPDSDEFEQWWARRGKNSGMPKPVSSVIYNQALDEHAQWESDFLLALEHQQENEGRNPPSNSTEHAHIRRWINTQVNIARRTNLNDLQRDRIRRLREEGIIRPYSQDESEESWYAHYSELLQYCARHGKLPTQSRQGQNDQASTSHDLGKWFKRQQTLAGREDQENLPLRYQRLRNDGYLGSYDDINWNLKYKVLRQYYELSGNKWPKTTTFKSWRNAQRDRHFKGVMSDEQHDKLNEININWNYTHNRNRVKILRLAIESRDKVRQETGDEDEHAEVEFVKRAKLAGHTREELEEEEALGYSLEDIWDNL